MIMVSQDFLHLLTNNYYLRLNTYQARTVHARVSLTFKSMRHVFRDPDFHQQLGHSAGIHDERPFLSFPQFRSPGIVRWRHRRRGREGAGWRGGFSSNRLIGRGDRDWGRLGVALGREAAEALTVLVHGQGSAAQVRDQGRQKPHHTFVRPGGHQIDG